MTGVAAAGPLPIVRVAVPAPVRGEFHYTAPGVRPATGARVRVPFGRGQRVGVCLGPAATTPVDADRLRPIAEVLDPEPLLPAATLALLEWAAAYYHHPLGEVVQQALPGLLRRGRAPAPARATRWQVTPAGAEALGRPRRAARQEALLRLLLASPGGLTGAELRARAPAGTGAALRALMARGWVVEAPVRTGPEPRPAQSPPVLNPAQAEAVAHVLAEGGRFQAWLLEGVTGSGKTEVYLRVIQGLVDRGRQALVLVPEIGLAPQTLDRFRRRLGVPVAVLHSGLGDRERLAAWRAARDGQAGVVVGTRSAVFVPLPSLGVVIVDEEHDLSYKQQEGFRYSARDLAVVRARQEGVPVLLGSATPSLESLHNVRLGRYRRVALPYRATGAPAPTLALVDLRRRRLRHGLSEALLAAVAARLDRQEQVLLFLNRRGFAPALICHDCGWAATCSRCDAHLTLHRDPEGLLCHHCGAARARPAACPACGSADLRPVGSGTERIEAGLRDAFPRARLARIDRDTVRRRGALESALARVHAGEADVLIGTQMLAKGHDFPRVTLVGVVDADGGLFSADFRASEHLAQRVLQVAGRAGRAYRPGEVLVQTHFPEHPLLRALLAEGYPGFAQTALAEREAAGLPPFSSAALLRAEAADPGAAAAFLAEAATGLAGRAPAGLQVLGPAPAPMARRAGRHRAQLLLLAPSRSRLRAALEGWVPMLEGLESGRRLRWSLDVDPVELT